jgi:hypothetical protein
VKRFLAAGGAIAATLGAILWFLLLIHGGGHGDFHAPLSAADRPQRHPGAGHAQSGQLAVRLLWRDYQSSAPGSSCA